MNNNSYTINELFTTTKSALLKAATGLKHAAEDLSNFNDTSLVSQSVVSDCEHMKYPSCHFRMGQFLYTVEIEDFNKVFGASSYESLMRCYFKYVIPKDHTNLKLKAGLILLPQLLHATLMGVVGWSIQPATTVYERSAHHQRYCDTTVVSGVVERRDLRAIVPRLFGPSAVVMIAESAPSVYRTYVGDDGEVVLEGPFPVMLVRGVLVYFAKNKVDKPACLWTSDSWGFVGFHGPRYGVYDPSWGRD